ncbi:MAG: substrate-binding domain-containing protein [Desulfobacterales bacterium]
MDTKNFPVIPSDRSDDLHNLEIADGADLVLFMAGNQFMAMKEIVFAFKKEYPDIKYIFYETLPPGLELKQILAGGAFFRGRIIDVRADIYSSVNEKAMKTLEEAGYLLKKDYHLYLHNRLTLMVPKNNPAGITSVADLGRDSVRVSQPDPANEDIAFHKASGIEIDVVEPGEDLDQRSRINYYICKLKHAPRPENADKFIDFIRSSTARHIYEKFGFLPPVK